MWFEPYWLNQSRQNVKISFNFDSPKVHNYNPDYNRIIIIIGHNPRKIELTWTTFLVTSIRIKQVIQYIQALQFKSKGNEADHDSARVNKEIDKKY